MYCVWYIPDVQRIQKKLLMRVMKRFFIIYSIGFMMLFACNDNKSVTSEKKDSPELGEIFISVDESFRPVIEQQIKMYQQSYPNTKIHAQYKSESDCMRDFFFDTTNRLVIVGKGLERKESIFLRDSLGYLPGDQEIATDAVVLLLHRDNPDSMYTKAGLRDALNGKSIRKKTFVFDGLNATSTVRYIRDSILLGKNYDSSIVRATRSSAEVMDYVSSHPEAIGVLGISWVGNPEDSEQQQKMQNLKLAYVQCEVCEGKPFVKPMQASTLTRRYPLLRPMHYLIKENYKGLGSGFTAFLKYERGQLIFRRAYLSPVMDFEIRNVQINSQIP
jgi:phosphate transport system substrate-binding protein